MVFEGHPLSTNILGTKASVKRITRDELLKFVKENFTPDKMAFTIVADIDEKKMEKQVLKMTEEVFKGLDAQAIKEEAKGETKAPVAIPFNKTLNKRNHQANCII